MRGTGRELTRVVAHNLRLRSAFEPVCRKALNHYMTCYVSCYMRILCNAIWHHVVQGFYSRSPYVSR
eukprot:6197715-Pleurochrysis_carterae.AAC.2